MTNFPEVDCGVFKAICKVTRDLSKYGITKDRTNTQQGYKFRGIDDVYNAMSIPLADAGLCVIPHYANRAVIERETAKGGAIFNVTVDGTFTLVSSEDGSSTTAGPFFGEAMDTGDKATNKAMSASYKYMCMQVFCIPTEGDNDADKTTHEVKPASRIEQVKGDIAKAKAVEPKGEAFAPDPEDLKALLDQIQRDPDAITDVGTHFRELITEELGEDAWKRARKMSIEGKPPLETTVRRLYWMYKSKHLAAK